MAPIFDDCRRQNRCLLTRVFPPNVLYLGILYHTVFIKQGYLMVFFNAPKKVQDAVFMFNFKKGLKRL